MSPIAKMPPLLSTSRLPIGCSLAFTFLFLVLASCTFLHTETQTLNPTQQYSIKLVDQNTKNTSKDPRWPYRQLNVLVDKKILNETEQFILATIFNQLERRTCLKIQRLPDNWLNITERGNGMNNSTIFQDQDKNFIHVGKSQFKTHNRLVGFSSLGCVRMGRQSLVLTDLAFKWPELVLRYHILRTLGVDGIERPDERENSLSSPINQLSRNQKIFSNEKTKIVLSANNLSAYGPRVEYLSEEDLERVKHLYECPEIHNRLSVKPVLDIIQASTRSSLNDSKYTTKPMTPSATRATIVEPPSTVKRKSDDKTSSVAKQIVDDLKLADKTGDIVASIKISDVKSTTSSYCSSSKDSTCVTSASSKVIPQSERPMILKLDGSHSQDPHLLQTNQIRVTSLKKAKSNASISEPQLMNGPDMDLWRRKQRQQTKQLQELPFAPQVKQELIMSFEANNNQFNGGNPIDNLASSQVLKLCSCSCQTMRPQPTEPPYPQPTFPPFTYPPQTETPTFPETEMPPFTILPPTKTTEQPTILPPTITTTEVPVTTTTTVPPSTTSTPEPTITTLPQTPPTATNTQPPFTITTITEAPPRTSIITTSSPVPVETSTLAPPPLGTSFCDSIQWVQPNKTVYASSRIVWDVDRGNQNYFLCSTVVNGAVIPGKTHGFSCKVSNEGVAYETHQFSVLTKPEHVSLAWVQKNSDSFGKTNFPVIGGFSKSQDPFIVSRCLVRDENNDVITLIGYVNNHGSGWFPFDDIQIECAQYDVLACVG